MTALRKTPVYNYIRGNVSYLILPTDIEKHVGQKTPVTFHFSDCSEQDRREDVSDMDQLKIQRKVISSPKITAYISHRSDASEDHHQSSMVTAFTVTIIQL